MSFLNRERELAWLQEVHDRPGAQFIAVYGRRRIGKTSLLVEWADRHASSPSVYWVAQRSTPSVLLAKFSRALQPLLDTSDPDFSFSSWDAALAEVARLTRRKRLVLILDELPYLLESVPSFTSVLQAAWDGELKKGRIVLIVAGSHQQMMEAALRSGRAPLFGRTTADLLLEEIEPAQLGLFLPSYGPEQLVETYSVIGGVPKYLEMWNHRRPVLRNVEEVVLSPMTIFRNEPVLLIHDEIAEPRTYLAILEAIGPGARRPVDIAQRTGIDVAHVGKYLQVLRSLKFVRRIVSVDARDRSSSRNSRYEIRDPYLRFHFTHVLPNIQLVEQGRTERVMELIRQGFDSYVGKTGYEEVCRTHVARLADQHELPFDGLDVGRIWSRNAEIDIACMDRRRRSALLGECRWSRRKMTEQDLDSLRARVGRLPKLNELEIHFVLFSRAGFTARLRERAQAEEVRLVEGVPW